MAALAGLFSPPDDEALMPSQVDHQQLQQQQLQQQQQQQQQQQSPPNEEQKRRMSMADFEALALIGRGAFGEVRLVRERSTREVYALKSMIKQAMVMKNQVTHLRNERDLLVAVAESPWIVEMKCSFQDSRQLYMVMEFLPGGDLMALLIQEDTFTEAATRFYMAEVALAIQSVHALGYIHRDLKPDNILINWDGHIKLTDLGLCTMVGHTHGGYLSGP